jgi:hypothetical protein
MDGNDEDRILAVEQRGTVRYLTLDRPDVLNARLFSDDDEITRVAGEVEGRGRRSLAVSTDDEAVHRSLEAVVGAEVTPLCFTRTAKHCRGRWSSRQAWASTNRFTKRPIEQ